MVSGKINLVDPKSTLWSSPVAILAETILVDQESPFLLPNSCVSTCYMVCWWNTHGLLKPMVNWLNPIENIRQIPTVKNHFGCSAPHVKHGRPTGPQLAMKQHWSTWPLKNNIYIYITHSMPLNSTESHSIQSYFHQDPMKSYQNHIQSNYNPMKSQNLMKSHEISFSESLQPLWQGAHPRLRNAWEPHDWHVRLRRRSLHVPRSKEVDVELPFDRFSGNSWKNVFSQ